MTARTNRAWKKSVYPYLLGGGLYTLGKNMYTLLPFLVKKCIPYGKKVYTFVSVIFQNIYNINKAKAPFLRAGALSGV